MLTTQRRRLRGATLLELIVTVSIVGILMGGASRGAGFVWRAGGLVVTAAHVVAAGGEIRVRTADGREVAARPVGVDEVSDVALLRIDADPPPAIQAPADAAGRGDPVAAIGDPAGSLT